VRIPSIADFEPRAISTPPLTLCTLLLIKAPISFVDAELRSESLLTSSATAGETSTVLSSPRSLNGRVQRQKIRLVCDIRNHSDDPSDLLRALSDHPYSLHNLRTDWVPSSAFSTDCPARPAASSSPRGDVLDEPIHLAIELPPCRAAFA
jgi:hypothetical protein